VAVCSRCGAIEIEPTEQVPDGPPAKRESQRERLLAQIREQVQSGELVIRHATPAEREAWGRS
jgi:hypothetical protein